MGWLFAVVMLYFGCRTGNDIFIIASGLYAIAGAIGYHE